MMTAESQHLLADYVASGSERAFQELVARYVDLVYSAALRLVDGDSHRAQDVAQTVFIDLARMAPQLSPNTMLGGWLHRHTCFVARTLMRGERRRAARERQAVEMSALESHPDAALAEVAAVLDEAIHELGPDDRDAILLRFFERRNLRAVGEALGLNENVAQKRVARAVQELALLLRKRGFTLSAAALAAALSASAVKAAPAGLALGLAKAALAGAGTTTSTAGTAAKLALLAKLKIGLAGLIIVAGLGSMVWLQFPSRARQPEAQQLPPSPPADPPADEPPSAPVAAADPLPAIERHATTPVSQPPPEPPVVARPVPVAHPALSAVAALEAAFPPGDFVRRFVARSGSRLTIEGTTSQGKWQVQSDLLQGFLETEPTLVSNREQERKSGLVTARAEVLVPVTSLKSIAADGTHYSDALDNVMYKQLLGKDGQQKKLRFQLTRLLLESPVKTNDAAFQFQAQGNLAVAGVTNPISLPVYLLPQPDGRWHLSGALALRLTSFGINPDELSALQGYIQPADEVDISFDWIIAPQNLSPTVARKDLVPLQVKLPNPGFKGTPPVLKTNAFTEPFPEKQPPPLLVPAGLKNLAQGAKVTCSDKNATAQSLSRITDGDKEASEQSIIYLRKGVQWVQFDFGRPQDLYAVALWHAHDAAKVYHAVAVQVADDADFLTNVRTLFNNDQENISGLGVGNDYEYFETRYGKVINAEGVKARYLRTYSKGSTQSALNEYTEVEVYGRRAQ